MTWPDAVGLVVAYLDQALTPTPVSSRVPKPRPDEFVQVRRVGGSATPPVRDQPRLDVFTWAPTDPEAMALAHAVREALWALAGNDLLGVTVYDITEFLGPRQDDDDVTGTPRVWATYSLTIRADTAIVPAPPAGS